MIAVMAVTKVNFVQKKRVPTSNLLVRELVIVFHSHGFVMVRLTFQICITYRLNAFFLSLHFYRRR